MCDGGAEGDARGEGVGVWIRVYDFIAALFSFADYACDAVEGAFAFLLDGAGAGAGGAVEDFGVDCEALFCFCRGGVVVSEWVGDGSGRWGWMKRWIHRGAQTGSFG